MDTPAKNQTIGSDLDTRTPAEKRADNLYELGYTTCIICGEVHPNTYGVDRPYVCASCNCGLGSMFGKTKG
jgi:hypothetical protein